MVNVVLDTNVLVAALRSKTGASARLVELLGTGSYRPVVTTSLCLEYESVLRRPGLLPNTSAHDLDVLLRSMSLVGVQRPVYFRWRPFLRDPGDDFILEAALTGGASFVITHNLRDFAGSESLGVRALTPSAFLQFLFSP